MTKSAVAFNIPVKSIKLFLYDTALLNLKKYTDMTHH